MKELSILLSVLLLVTSIYGQTVTGKLVDQRAKDFRPKTESSAKMFNISVGISSIASVTAIILWLKN
jgi:hypothetical protein